MVEIKLLVKKAITVNMVNATPVIKINMLITNLDYGIVLIVKMDSLVMEEIKKLVDLDIMENREIVINVLKINTLILDGTFIIAGIVLITADVMVFINNVDIRINK